MKKNSPSHGYVVGKGWCILITFSDNYGYSTLLILHKNSTFGSFLVIPLLLRLTASQNVSFVSVRSVAIPVNADGILNHINEFFYILLH